MDGDAGLVPGFEIFQHISIHGLRPPVVLREKFGRVCPLHKTWAYATQRLSDPSSAHAIHTVPFNFQ